MKKFFQQAFGHPKTTITGLVEAVAFYGTMAATLGVHVGHFGHADILATVTAVAMALKGAYSSDADKTVKKPN